MVQKPQFRLEHPDSHYCAAIFSYMQEYAVKYRMISTFVSLDVEGVLVGRNETFDSGVGRYFDKGGVHILTMTMRVIIDTVTIFFKTLNYNNYTQ